MPTLPISEFISRQIDEPKISQILEHMSSLIEEVVNYGSHVFRWAIDSIKAGDENAPALLMYRHIFELIDSASVLVRNACAEPCNILLRCLFESVLNYEYLFEKEFQTRGMDFLVWHRRKSLEVLKRFDPREAAFVRFEKMKEKDKISKNIQGRAVPDIEERIKSLQAIFLLPSYRDSSAEFDRIVALNGRPPKNWYSMRNGPDNLRQLAEYLGFPAQYEILYSSWSGLVHGTDILEDKISIVLTGSRCVFSAQVPF